MSRFYGTLQGNRGETTRTGSKKSGITTYTASWAGAVRTHAYINDDGEDWVRVEITTWRGKGDNKLLYVGPIGVFAPNGSL